MFLRIAALLGIAFAVSAANAARSSIRSSRSTATTGASPPTEERRRRREVWESPRPDAKDTKVPGSFRRCFPAIRLCLVLARRSDSGQSARRRPLSLAVLGRRLSGDVWVNGTHVGRHEGAQTRFMFDVTDAVKPGATNRIAIRVLSLFARWTDSSAVKRRTEVIGTSTWVESSTPSSF